MKKYLALLLSMLMITAALFTGCSQSKPETLEEVIASNEEVAEEINSGVEGTGIQIDVKDNTVTYTFDISSIDGVTDELIENEDFVESFKASLDSQEAKFADTCASLEEKTGIEGVTINVIFTYGDKEISKSTYTSADASAAESSEDDGSSEDE